MTDKASDIKALVEKVLETHKEEWGAEVYVIDVAVRGSEQMAIVEVFADTDNGITLDVCRNISRHLSDELDGLELEGNAVFKGNYRLEVSSPGATRPLVLRRQYPRHIGRNLKVKCKTVSETGETVYQTVVGKLMAVDSESIRLAVGHGKTEQALTIPFETIAEAKVELKW
jgi:ribosome maturation factor RimP